MSSFVANILLPKNYKSKLFVEKAVKITFEQKKLLIKCFGEIGS